MEENRDTSGELVQLLLAKCDRQYQEIRRLEGRLDANTDMERVRASYEKSITSHKETITTQQATISKLEQQVAYLQRRLWGKSTERFVNPDPLQRKIDFEGLDLLPEEESDARNAQEEIRTYRKAAAPAKEKQRPLRKPIPDTLPRVEEHIYPDNINTEQYSELEPEITEVIEFEPGRFWVRRIIRHKYVLKDKSVETDTPVVTPPLPTLPLAKSNAGATLLAELMVGKYADHLPFYRQIQMFSRLGVTLPASTVNGWFRETADLLRPLYYRLRELVLESDYIQVDESTLPVIDNEKHKAVKGYIWVVRSVMRNMVFFHYDHGSRAQKVVIPLLKEFRGALQTDGYEVYKMYEGKKGVLPIGCWAHVRRKFEEALKEDLVRAGYALEQIGMLYQVERRADEEELGYEERSELRCRLSYPIMVAFEKWLVNEYPKVLPKSRIGRAIKYAYEIYPKLTRYHLDGRYRIDNNLVENTIRPLAIGRKNWLFCGNDDAAEDAAIMYSMMGCCKAAGVDFRKWFVHLLNHIHDYDTDYSIDLAQLLPHNQKSQTI